MWHQDLNYVPRSELFEYGDNPHTSSFYHMQLLAWTEIIFDASLWCQPCGVLTEHCLLYILSLTSYQTVSGVVYPQGTSSRFVAERKDCCLMHFYAVIRGRYNCSEGGASDCHRLNSMNQAVQ